MITEDFLLQTALAKKLYQSVKDLPIIDYHNHLDPKEIYDNHPIMNVGSIWLEHDHYKWRLMRQAGIKEATITGHTDYALKFYGYVKALEKSYLNPLYHWSHMELKKYFDIDDVIKTSNAENIYHKINQTMIQNPRGPRDYIEESNVEALCTTDAVDSSLEYHIKLKDYAVKVLPTFRPDSIVLINSDQFLETLKNLEKLEGIKIDSFDDLLEVLKTRVAFFNEVGCVLADHGISVLEYHEVSPSLAKHIFDKKMTSQIITDAEELRFQIYMIQFFMKQYKKYNWTAQLHIGALRNNNKKVFEEMGRDAGCDSLADQSYLGDLNKLFSELEYEDALPKTIVYNLNPKDTAGLASVCGNFFSTEPGKIQLGAPWWFNDHFEGIINHLKVQSSYLSMNQFVGMLTDSRSYLSFVRHDYFRRILCNFIAERVLLGHIPNDEESLIELVQNISYYNSKNYLGI